MDSLEKQLNKLPKSKMRKKSKIFLMMSLYSLAFKKHFSLRGFSSLSVHRYGLVSLLVLIFSLPLYAYSSPRVNETHFLSPLKRSIESLELKITKDKELEYQKYKKFSERRLEEAELLSASIKKQEDREALSNTIEKVVEYEKQARYLSPQAKVTENDNTENKERKKLEKIAGTVGIAEEEKLIEAIALAIEGVKNNSKKERFSGGTLHSATSSKSNGRDKKQEIGKLKKEINLLKKGVDFKGYNESDVEVLFDKLDKRVDYLDKALKKGEMKGVDGFIDSTKAITNNAKSFMKKNGQQKKEKKKNPGKGKK